MLRLCKRMWISPVVSSLGAMNWVDWSVGMCLRIRPSPIYLSGERDRSYNSKKKNKLLGSEGNQNRAILELVTQPMPPALASIEEVLADYRADLESIRSLTKDEEELIMNLSVAYLKKREEWKEEGKEEGREEIVMNMLRRGLDAASIFDLTGLSIKTIEKLRDRLSLNPNKTTGPRPPKSPNSGGL
jgi:hypothetical protein